MDFVCEHGLFTQPEDAFQALKSVAPKSRYRLYSTPTCLLELANASDVDLQYKVDNDRDDAIPIFLICCELWSSSSDVS